MLLNRNNNKNSIFSSEVVERLGMSPDGIFQIVGTAPEPQYAWEPEEQRFTDVISGYGIWVRQDYKQFKKNPILVVIPHMSQKKAKSFEFAENVQFNNLGGYYSRKNHVYRWQAGDVSKVESTKEGEK